MDQAIHGNPMISLAAKTMTYGLSIYQYIDSLIIHSPSMPSPMSPGSAAWIPAEARDQGVELETAKWF